MNEHREAYKNTLSSAPPVEAIIIGFNELFTSANSADSFSRYAIVIGNAPEFINMLISFQQEIDSYMGHWLIEVYHSYMTELIKEIPGTPYGNFEFDYSLLFTQSRIDQFVVIVEGLQRELPKLPNMPAESPMVNAEAHLFDVGLLSAIKLWMDKYNTDLEYLILYLLPRIQKYQHHPLL